MRWAPTPRFLLFTPTLSQRRKVLRPGSAQPRQEHTTLLASMSLKGMGPCLAVEGTTSATIFESHVQRALAPTLKGGRIIVVENLSAHKGERVRELIEMSEAASFYTCHLTRPISILSRKPSRRSKDCCARRRHEAAKPLLKRWGERSRRSARWMPGVSSKIVATVYPSLFCETRCRNRDKNTTKAGFQGPQRGSGKWHER